MSDLQWKPQESQAGKARAWTSRACDRCRRRKARCDEAVPCKNCWDARVECTHNAPVRKRGPKPKQKGTDLEERLRNLEHLMSSIPGPSGSSTQGLTASEISEIRSVAQPPDEPTLAMDMGVPTQPWDGAEWAALLQPQPAESSPSGSGRRPQDMLYRDMEGTTRYLGPSSGMPLLDQLRISTVSSSSPSAEEWISLSTALGFNAEWALPTHDDDSANDDLWKKVTAACPQDLVDSLVRAYFTISHLLWPVLHAPTFMGQYHNPAYRRDPSFCFLVISICCLSTRYYHDGRLFEGGVKSRLLATAISMASEDRSDLFTVQALFNMSVVQEGTSQPYKIWKWLSPALSMSLDLGLHRRADEWNEFTAVDIEVRKRTMWAIYCLQTSASTAYGRPLLLSADDLDLEEPAITDDAYIDAQSGIGTQPVGRPQVIASLVTAARLHMILEKTIRWIDRANRSPDANSFQALVSPTPPVEFDNAASLLPLVTTGLDGDWSFTADTVADPDNVRFFQRTRVFCLQHFIRLLIARHRFSQDLEIGAIEAAGEVTNSAVKIISAYCAIDFQERLGFFGAHAIAQLTQAGTGLMGVLLHLRAAGLSESRDYKLALQGIPGCVQVLSRLGQRRPAGRRSAEILAEFARACQIPIPESIVTNTGDAANVAVPMFRSLPRKGSTTSPPISSPLAGGFDAWISTTPGN